MNSEKPCTNDTVCEHKFVRDLIDITPDKSKEIIYCIFCEYIPK